MSWTCPACKENNHDDMGICACGYDSDQQGAAHAPADAERARDAKAKPSEQVAVPLRSRQHTAEMEDAGPGTPDEQDGGKRFVNALWALLVALPVLGVLYFIYEDVRAGSLSENLSSCAGMTIFFLVLAAGGWFAVCTPGRMKNDRINRRKTGRN